MTENQDQSIPQVKTVKRKDEPVIDTLDKKPKKTKKITEAIKKFNKLNPSTKLIIILGGFSIGIFILIGVGAQIRETMTNSLNTQPKPTPIPTFPQDKPTPRPTRAKTQTELHLEYIQDADFEKTNLLPPKLDQQIKI